jgi:AcrR family transcriptional regulator
MSAGSLFTYVESKEALFHLVFLYGLELLPEAPALPLATPEPGETVTLFGRALSEAPVSRLRAALAGNGPNDVGEELRGIVEELYDTVERQWPLFAVVERCATELAELEALWFGETRAGIFAELTEYLQRRAAAGQLRAMPDAQMAARLIAELVAWLAWHRRKGRDSGLYDDKIARSTAIEFISAALAPPAGADPSTERPAGPARGAATLSHEFRRRRSHESWT